MAARESWIDSAFRSSRVNEVYLFMKNEYVLVNYAPCTTKDYVVNGPLPISSGYPSLAGTVFGDVGIDCAFGCPGTNRAFIFSGDLCAKIDYAPHTTNDRIIQGPMTIAQMFPCLKNSGFDKGLDAAFESTRQNEAYIFRGRYYALINYAEGRLLGTRPITEGFPCLANTLFESGIGAAFASHRYSEAYLFKDQYYARLYFTPGATNDYIMGGIKCILPNWPSLRGILPRKNSGVNPRKHPEPIPEQPQCFIIMN